MHRPCIFSFNTYMPMCIYVRYYMCSIYVCMFVLGVLRLSRLFESDLERIPSSMPNFRSTVCDMRVHATKKQTLTCQNTFLYKRTVYFATFVS